MDARVSTALLVPVRGRIAHFVRASRGLVARRLGASLTQGQRSGRTARPCTLVPGSWLPHSTTGFRAFGIYDEELEDMGRRR